MHNLEGHSEFVLKRISRWCFFITVGISTLSLLGWVTGLLVFASVKPNYIPIAPSTALCFDLLGVPLFFYVLHPDSTVRRMVTTAAALLTSLICLILLAGFFSGTTFEAERLGIQSSVAFGPVPIGHMSPITAITFLITTTGVLFLVVPRNGKQLFKNVAAFTGMGVMLIGFIVILGYLHGTPLLYGGDIIPVALPTAIAFELIGFGLITASGPTVLPIKVFAGPTVRSRLMRAFIPAITTFVLIVELVYKATFTSATHPILMASLIALLSMIIVSILISKIAKTIGGEIDRAHIERDQAEEKLKLDEDRLETLLKLSLMEVKAEKELTDFALEESVRLTGSKGGYLHFFNEEQQSIQLYSWSKAVLKICTATQDHHYPLESAGVWADSIRLRRPVIHNEYQSLPDKKGYPEGHFHLVRHLGIPIFDGDRIVGVTGVGNKEGPYDEADARQVTLLMQKLWAILNHRRSEAERERLILELKGALDKVKTLSGMLPICASCKKIRDDSGYWQNIEHYIHQHSEAEFSHGICPDCIRKLYPEHADKILRKTGDT